MGKTVNANRSGLRYMADLDASTTGHSLYPKLAPCAFGLHMCTSVLKFNGIAAGQGVVLASELKSPGGRSGGF